MSPRTPSRAVDRRHFIGGSDARIIMGQDERALIRLWQEKRGEVGPEDLTRNLIVQLGLATEDLNRYGACRHRSSDEGQAPGPLLLGRDP
jgi:predicted phage-related endonuclease